MKVLDDHANKHIEDKESNEEEEGDEVDQSPLVEILLRLLVNPDSVQSVIHDVHPAVLGGENKQRHEGIENVVKIVFLIDPSVF